MAKPLPIRKLGAVGIIPDVDPHDLPPNAFSHGSNVRFAKNKLTRAPVLRSIVPAIKSTVTYDDAPDTYESAAGFYHDYAPLDGEPVQRIVGTARSPGLGDTVVVADNDGTVRGYRGKTFMDITPTTGFARLIDDCPWTVTELAGLCYLNREVDAPYYWNPISMAGFEYLPNWPADTKASVIRGFGDYLCAYRITKAAVEYPTMVKWSTTTLAGAVPASWDHTDPTNNAGENPLSQMTTAIKDALPLDQRMIIYSTDQVWFQEQTGGQDVFRFGRLFPQGGIINTNCVVEVERQHFVFGANDLYVHDGVSQRSIAEGRVRDFVFGALKQEKAQYCFVAHNPVLNEVIFAFHSVDPDARWQGVEFCNRGAVYNYRHDTWSFIDLPNVIGASLAAFDNSPTYQDIEGTFQTAGGNFRTLFDDAQEYIVFLGVGVDDLGLTESRLYGLDLLDGGTMPYPVQGEVMLPAYARREGIDLDEVGGEVRGYKMLKGIWPQAKVSDPSGTLEWRFGGADYPSIAPRWSPKVTQQPQEQHRVDCRVSGRYVAYEVTSPEGLDFVLTGFDGDVVQTGRR